MQKDEDSRERNLRTSLEVIRDIMRYGSTEAAEAAREEQRSKEERIESALAEAAKAKTPRLAKAVLESKLTPEELEEVRFQRFIMNLARTKTEPPDVTRTRKMIREILRGEWEPD